MPAPLIAAVGSVVVPKAVEFGLELIDRLWPDPAEADKAKLELFKLERSGQLAELESAKQLALAQLAVNEVEAANPNLLVSGWRPAAGWAGVAGFVYATLGYPFIGWVSNVNGWAAPPALDDNLLWLVLSTLLGVGTLRTIEKARGVAAR